MKQCFSVLSNPRLKIPGLALLLVLGALSAQAATLGGNFSADGNGANAIVSLSNIIFSPSTNNWRVTSSSFTYTSGSLNVGDIGTLKNLQFPLPIDQWMTFNGKPLDFVLTGVGPGDTTDPNNCSTATSAGKSCSLLLAGGLGVSPVVLTWTAGGTSVSLHVFGTVTDGTQTAAWQADLNTTLTGPLNSVTNPSFNSATSHPIDLFNFFTANPNGTVTSSYSGTVSAQVSAIPEPASLGLVGSALLLAGVVLRRRRA